MLSWQRHLGLGQSQPTKDAPSSGGTAPTGKPVVTRQGIKQYLTEESRPFWQALVQQFKRDSPASKTGATGKVQHPHDLQQDTQAALQEQLARNARLKELLRSQQVSPPSRWRAGVRVPEPETAAQR